MQPGDGRRRVAIACQGGGSHTAFTAGVLGRLLGAEELRGYDVAGLSGTSGGAACALLAWSALLDDEPARAGTSLDEFWRDVAAATPAEAILNAWTVWAGNLQNYVATPALSPYDNPLSGAGLDELRRALERQVDFRRLDGSAPDAPTLLVGAVDVLSGEFLTFNSRTERITVEAILASAAIPTLSRAVRLEGRLYWDGLFSQNPPVRELVDVGPDEIWVIQINPQRRDAEPTTVFDIADRRNELAGNLSLHQELFFVEKINQMLELGVLAPGAYRQIVVRVIELSGSGLSRPLGPTSKLDRDPAFIRELIAHGEARAEEFLTALAFESAWRGGDAEQVARFFADAAELGSSPPFPDGGASAGTAGVERFVREHMTGAVSVDLTRRTVARDGVAWTVRAAGDGQGDRVEGTATARFRDGRIVAFRLGSPSARAGPS